MASSLSLQERLVQVNLLHSDRRTKDYKVAVRQAYHETIAELRLRVKTLEQKTRFVNEGHEEADSQQCSICMEDMCGKVSLSCGHEMCPKCFAQHSRVSNTCPFCREEFAPKPKRQSKMSEHQLDYIADSWVDSNLTDDYFESCLLYTSDAADE